MIDRRRLALVCLVAALHGLFFIWYQRPDWATSWPDQDGYRRLGAVLADTGRFTRFPAEPRFVPEVIRTPGYPAFVALVYMVAGRHQAAIALAQTIAFVLICCLVWLIGREMVTEHVALAAAAATALYSPIPYFGALVMTEVWTTLLLTLGLWLCFRTRRTQRITDAIAAGIVLAAVALTRPVFVLLPFVLCAVAAATEPIGRRRTWAIAAGVAMIALLPWFAYNYVNLNRVALSPAGGLGRAVWEGSWQGRWSGRVHNELTHTADAHADRGELAAAVDSIAVREHLDPIPMLTYVHQWQEIRQIWTRPIDPYERALARMAADSEYLRVGVANIRTNLLPYLWRRTTRGLFVLWAAEIPVRYTDINRLPVTVIRTIWAAEVLILAAAGFGLAALLWNGAWRDGAMLAAPVLYITAVHFPLLTEARQSLPAMPVVLLLAVIGVTVGVRHVRQSAATEIRVDPA